MSPQTHDRDGFPTEYGFACGIVARYAPGPADRVVMERGGGVYHVKGFLRGAKFWHSFSRLKDAKRKYLSLTAAMMVRT